MDTIADRIKKALEVRSLKQADLVEMTGIGKSSISTYISGSYEPKQKNIYKISKALNVSEAWLMGGNVPMEKDSSETAITVSKEHQELITAYDNAPFDKKNIARLTLGMTLLKEEDMELKSDLKTS